MQLLQSHKTFVQEQWSTIDKRTISILIWVAVLVSCVYYLGDPSFWTSLESKYKIKFFQSFLVYSSNARLYRLLWWVSTVIVCYLIIPICIIKFYWKQELKQFGLKFKGALRDYPLYIIMLAIMIPLVLFFAQTDSFQTRYPFYKPTFNEALYPNFIIWELFYFFQFVAVEFFFRGFMVHGLKRSFGVYSIFIMVIPYCMIHFGKPFPETLAAILAGIALGYLSYKNNSVLLGIVIHFSVAITMDLCALYFMGF